MLDILTIVFWSLTYVLIVIAGFKSRNVKKVSMPYIAGVLNFSWEICALIVFRGNWGHVLWLLLDCVIVYFGFSYLGKVKQRLLYIISIVVITIVLFHIFKLPDGALISVFIIDLIMAIDFIVQSKALSSQFKVPIAITKLIGDLFAGIMCATSSILIAILAVLVFLCNLFYLCYCFEEQSKNMKAQKR